MKTQDQIRADIAGLRSRLAQKLGIYLDPELLQSVIEAKLASKTIDEVDSIIGTYNLDELLIAAEANSEMDGAAGGEGEQH